MEGRMSPSEIGILAFVISMFATFIVVLAWASRHGG
jgi:hypothetical protein